MMQNQTFYSCCCYVQMSRHTKVVEVSDSYVVTSSQGNKTSSILSDDLMSKFPFRWQHVMSSIEVLTRPRHHRCRLHILVLFATIFIQQTCKSGELDATLLFAEAAPLSWRKSMYGYLVATDYAFLGLTMLVFLPCLIRYFHLPDISMVLIGVAFRFCRLFVLAFSRSTLEVYISVIIGCPSALIISCSKAMISKMAIEGEMGKAFSLLSCAETVSLLLGSVIFSNVYNATKHITPGFVFLLESAFFFFYFFVLVLLGRDMKLAAQYNQLQESATEAAGSEFTSASCYGAAEVMTRPIPDGAACGQNSDLSLEMDTVYSRCDLDPTPKQRIVVTPADDVTVSHSVQASRQPDVIQIPHRKEF